MIAGVPYDAEIEYLESTGTQYINVGIPMTDGHSLETIADIAFTNTTDYQVNGGNGFYYWGVNGGKFAFNSNAGGSVNSNQFYNIDVLYDTVEGRRSFKTNGFQLVDNHYTVLSYTYNTILFALGSRVTITDGYYCHAKCKSCKYYFDGVLVRDLIPVRVGSVGYMYDRVTRRLFGNAGTGAFVLGPDVATPIMGLRRYPQSHLGKMGARHMIYGGN